MVAALAAPMELPALGPTRTAPEIVKNTSFYEAWPLDAPGRWAPREEILGALEEARRTIPEKLRKFADCLRGGAPSDPLPVPSVWLREALGGSYASSRGFTSAAQREGAGAELRFAESTFAPLHRIFLPMRPSRMENLYGHVDVRFVDRVSEASVTVDVKGFRTIRARLQDALIVVERKCARNKSEAAPFNGWLHSRALDTVAFRVRLGSDSPDTGSFVILDRERLLDWTMRVVDWEEVYDSGAFYEDPVPYRAVSRRSNAYDKSVRWDLFAYVPLVEAVRASGVALVGGGECFPPNKQTGHDDEDAGDGGLSQDRVGAVGAGMPLEACPVKRHRLGKD